jgi:Ni/Fe-hydrogenase subunit HybB-like protein
MSFLGEAARRALKIERPQALTSKGDLFLLAGVAGGLGLGLALAGASSTAVVVVLGVAASFFVAGALADGFRMRREVVASAVIAVPRAPPAPAQPEVTIEEGPQAASLQQLTHTVLRPLTGGMSYSYAAVLGALLMLVGIGIFAYARQLDRGLEVTGLHDRVAWGFYITNFVFFIGISHAGTLISAILRVTGAEWRRPITRMAELITVAALLVGATMPLLDLGRPDRVLNIIIHGRLQSPQVWDLLAITTYMTGSLIYLYLPMIPDIAICRDKLGSTAAGWRRRLYTTLALNWRGTAAQKASLNRAIGVMAIVIIPVAVSVHTVVSWIFAMTMRPGWHSTIFGPYFVIGAIFSGIASIIIVMAILRKAFHLEKYLTEQHFKYLGILLLVFTALYIYFTLAEYLTIGYNLEVEDRALLEQLMVGQYAVYFWMFAIGGLIIPAILLAMPWTQNIPGILIAAILINIGMWLKRFIIVIPSMAIPLMPYEWGTYSPTWVEWSILVASFAGFAVVFVLFAKLFPLISIWEVEEGMEKEAEARGESARPEEHYWDESRLKDDPKGGTVW